MLCGTTPSILVEPRARERAIADRRGYVSIRRLVASEHLGRWVTRAEGVAPIDGDPWNWDPRNLRIEPLAARLPQGGIARARRARVLKPVRRPR